MTVAPTPLPGRHLHLARLTLAAILLVLVAVAGTVLALRGDGTTGGSTVVRGSGVAASETRTLPAFRGVELAGANTLRITVGRPQSVVVHADQNLLRLVGTRVSSGTLVVDTEGSFTTRSPMRVDVSLPRLHTLVMSGSGIATAAGIDQSSLSVRLSGSGVIQASGSVERLDVQLGGAGDIRLGSLPSRDVTAAVPGSGRIYVRATGSLDATVAGTGTIVYSGDPARVTQRVTGTGAITRG